MQLFNVIILIFLVHFYKKYLPAISPVDDNKINKNRNFKPYITVVKFNLMAWQARL